MNIQLDRDALIIVDPQLDYMPGGCLAVAGADDIIGTLNGLAERFVEVIIAHDHHPPGHISFAGSFVDRGVFSRMTLEEFEGGSVQLSDSAEFTLGELGTYLGGLSRNGYLLQPSHCVIGSEGARLDPRLELSAVTLILRKGYRPGADCRSAFCESDGATTGLASLLTVKGIERIFVAGLAGEHGPAHTALDALDAGFEAVFLEDLSPLLGSERGEDEAMRARMVDAGVTIVSHSQISL